MESSVVILSLIARRAANENTSAPTPWYRPQLLHGDALSNDFLWTAQAEDLLEDAVGEVAFGHLGEFEGGGWREKGDGVAVGVEADTFARDVVENDGVGTFAQQLRAGVRDRVLRLGGEADDELSRMAAGYGLGKYVFSRLELDGERAGALHLLLGRFERAIVGDGSGLDDDGGLVHAAEYGGTHLLRSDYRDDFDIGGRTQRGRRGDENDARPAAFGGFGQGVSHLSAGAVAEKAHWIEGFAGASGGDEHRFTDKIVALVQDSQNDFNDG